METIHDDDLRLRPVNLQTDVDAAVPWYQDPEVLMNSEGGADPYDRDIVDRMYRYVGERGELYHRSS